MKLVRISPMDKLLPGDVPNETQAPVEAPQNGHIFFQIAYKGEQARSFDAPLLTVQVKSDVPVSVYRVELVPCTLPAYPDADENYITKVPGLIPDRLVPCNKKNPIRLLSDYWQTIWVEVYEPAGVPAGKHGIELSFLDESGKIWGEIALDMCIQERMLPPQSFMHTQWLHLDCICHAHHCKAFSEEFWKLAEQYLRCQIEHGINVAWVPIFTPPLDTAVGAERKTIQLVDVTGKDGEYCFDFTKLDRWLNLCMNLGFTYYEFSHFFTQWGAHASPKIMVTEDGEQIKKFGWHTAACGEAYVEFLKQFLPALRQQLEQKNIYSKSMFHISDEPTPEHTESYKQAKTLVQTILPDVLLRDTLSDLVLYQERLIEHPIVSISHAKDFQSADVSDLWLYYSCVDGRDYSNCFLAMPLSRVRAIGQQAMDFGASGFLHWAFNFWNTQLSKSAIDPSIVTDAGGAFPSGDSFLVYPDSDGPLCSMRLKMLAWAMEDIRSCEQNKLYPR